MGDLVELTDYRARRLVASPATRPALTVRYLEEEAPRILALLRSAQGDLEDAIEAKGTTRLTRIKQGHCMVKISADALQKAIVAGRQRAQGDMAAHVLLSLGLKGDESAYVGAARAIECVSAIMRVFANATEPDQAG